MNQIDLHGLHPVRDADQIERDIGAALRAAFDASASALVIVHGHGYNRAGWRPSFVNSNTGYLGQTVRRMLRNNADWRAWMLAKFSCAHDGSTTVFIRTKLAPTGGLRIGAR